MFTAAAAAILVSMLLALVRALAGPTLFDRILAVNAVGTLTVLMLAVIGFLTDRPHFLDLALIYALINFIGTIAVLKLFRHGHLRNEPTGEPGDDPIEPPRPASGEEKA